MSFEWDAAGGRLRLSAPLISAEWVAVDSGELLLVRLHDVRTGLSWVDPTPVDAVPLEDVAVDGAQVTVAVRSAGLPILARWTMQAFDEHATVRQWVELTASEHTTVERLPVFAASFGTAANGLEAHCGLDRRPYRGAGRGRADWYTWRSVPLGPGVVDAVRSGHRREATWLGMVAPGGGPGIYLGWESNAQATCEFGDLTGDGRVGVDCALYPSYRLEAGATLTGPAGFVGLAHGDLDELSYRCHRFVDDVLARRVDDSRFPYVEFNSWGYGADIDADGMRQCLDVCERLGVELFVVDFGWEDPDWKPLPDRFPKGLAPIAREAHDRGLLFGIHLSFGNVSSLSRMYAEHPEWAHGPGQWAYRRSGEVYGLTLGNPATRDWIVQKLVEVIDENGVDYFLTDHFLWGELPDSYDLHATNDYVTVAEGFDLVLARLRELRPDVVMEHCDDGLALPTFQMVRQNMTSIGVDAPGALWERVNKYRISRVLPPRYLDSYAPDQPMGDWELRSHMFGGPLILMTPLHTLSESSAEWSVLRRNIALYKSLRHRVLRGKVLHLLEPQLDHRVGDSWDGWDAIGSYDAETDSAVVFVHKLGSLATRRIPLHGLRPETLYRLSLVDAGSSSVVSGADLYRDGLTLTLDGERVSEVVLLAPEA